MNSAQLESLLLNLLIRSQVETLPCQTAHSLNLDASCREAIEAMINHKIGSVLVSNGDDGLAGIFTERDVLNRVWHDPRELDQIPLHEVMTPAPQHLKYHASVAKAVYLMDAGGYRHIPVISRDSQLAMISVTDFVRFVALKIGRLLERVEPNEVSETSGISLADFFLGDLSVLRPTSPLIVKRNASIAEAVEVMIEHRAGSVIVGIPEAKSVHGIFTERDLIKKIILSRSTASHESVEKFMTPHPVTLQPTTSVMYAFNSMNDGKFKHVPIVDFEERAIGMISSKNIVRFISNQILTVLEGRSAAS